MNFDEEVGRVKTKLFPGGKKTKLSMYLFLPLLTSLYNNNLNKKKMKAKKRKENDKKPKKMAGTPQQCSQLQQAQYIKENKTRREEKSYQSICSK